MGEVYRLVIAVQHDLRDMRKDLIGRGEYESDQEGIDRRFQSSVEAHTELKSDISSVIAESRTGIKDLSKRMDDAEKEARQGRGKWVLAMVTAAAGAVFSVIAAIALQGGGGG